MYTHTYLQTHLSNIHDKHITDILQDVLCVVKDMSVSVCYVYRVLDLYNMKTIQFQDTEKKLNEFFIFLENPCSYTSLFVLVIFHRFGCGKWLMVEEEKINRLTSY